MGIEIIDSTGTGKGLQIDSENRAVVRAMTETADFHINDKNGKVWSMPWENVTNTGANDYVFYLKNTGAKDLRVTDIRLSSDTITQVEVHIVTGTAGGGGTDVTPVPRNLGSSELPTADCVTDPDITGLTTAGTLFHMQLPVASTLYHLRTTSNLIIPKGKAIAILFEVTTCLTTGVVSLVEAE